MNVFALHGQDTFQVSRSGHSLSKIAVWQRKFARCGVVGTFVPKAHKSTGRDAFLRWITIEWRRHPQVGLVADQVEK